MEQQLNLFGEEEIEKPKPKRPSGGSQNPIVFNDYESYVAKFQDSGPKTTDDTYTPRDVYEAVLNYVGTIYDLTDKVILRPFYPGGDYEHAEYPENGVVIDNPPFSLYMPIVKFYTRYRIPFFIFGAGMTITNAVKYCTCVIVSEQIIFDNGAKVKCNFASNLYGDIAMTTAPELDEAIRQCQSQKIKAELPQFRYPDNLVNVSDMQTICRGGIKFSVSRKESVVVRDLDLHPKKGGLFGPQLLMSDAKGIEKESARLRAQELAREAIAQEQARKSIPIELSKRECRIVERLNKGESDDNTSSLF